MPMMRSELPTVAHLIRLRLCTTYAVTVVTPNDSDVNTRYLPQILTAFSQHDLQAAIRNRGSIA
jgi:hypothetical protein